MKKTLILWAVALIGLFILPNCSGGDDGNSGVCDESRGRERSDECWIRDFSISSSAYPNPVASNGTLNINVQFGAANTSMQFLNTTIHVRVWNSAGQLVSDTDTGTYPPNAGIQTIPIWSPGGIAQGTYSFEVTFDFGVCGSEILCIDKIIVAAGN
ncbi:hypothetical protein [Flavilitoribacter nigricans]|uniref:hypothetical protein n=1 Tax=Flavilitoribacter nigricans TaxID=70997 RepID=UPI00117B7A4E|nr:hypothetical protein [Flavilitoribacter nigricans]